MVHAGAYRAAPVRATMVPMSEPTSPGLTRRDVLSLGVATATALNASLGATALVIAGHFAGPYGLSPDAALHAVEPNTIALLVAMMIVSAAATALPNPAGPVAA